MKPPRGIAQIELAGDYYGRTPAQVRALVESFGMRVTSNHFGPRSMIQNIWYDAGERARIFEEAHALGLPDVAPATPTWHPDGRRIQGDGCRLSRLLLRQPDHHSDRLRPRATASGWRSRRTCPSRT
ncbi:hypothetical protein [Georgenia sp. SUBG003]|uniref:hypothetical protein n=1 Tax=Georgenia sp. SUBG003 TaxID=1497974 RepID=UPI003AB40F74